MTLKEKRNVSAEILEELDIGRNKNINIIPGNQMRIPICNDNCCTLDDSSTKIRLWFKIIYHSKS